MNIKTLIISCFLLVAKISFNQAFETNIFLPDIDFNHYSIETTTNGEYICAGTQFDQNGHTDIHVFRLNGSGSIIWEKKINISDDDRVLDFVINPFHEIVLTGYVSTSIGVGNLYLAKFDENGIFMGDKILDHKGYSTFGTNIIYSNANASYIVGGLRADDVDIVPTSDNAAILLEFDLCFNLVREREYGLTQNSEHTCINDIVELPNGYFITGSVKDPTTSSFLPHRQGVLALIIDGNFDIQRNFSYSNSNFDHCGVSAVYASLDDMIILLSNNSILHNPEILTIGNVSTPASATVVSNYYLDISNGISTHAAGFQLELVGMAHDGETHLGDGILVAGYLKGYDFGGGAPDDSPLWSVIVDALTGSEMRTARIFDVPSSNFSAHGGGLFSTFDGEAPYIFNQEILCKTSSDHVMVAIGPSEDPNYGINVVTLDFNNEPEGCFKYINYKENPLTINLDLAVKDFSHPYKTSSPWANVSNTYSEESPACSEGGMRLIDERNMENTSFKSPSKKLEFNIVPNPSSNNILIDFENCPIGGIISVASIDGKIQYSSEIIDNCDKQKIDIERYEPGTYLVNLDFKGVKTTKVLIKE